MLKRTTQTDLEHLKSLFSFLSPSLALLEDTVHWADGCTAAGEPTLGNRAQLLEDARQVHAQGALEGSDSPPPGHVCALGGKERSSPAASAFCCCTGE